MGPVRQNPIHRTVSSVHMCVHRTVHTCCTQYCTEQTDNFPSCPPDNHHCSNDVYLREGGERQANGSFSPLTFFMVTTLQALWNSLTFPQLFTTLRPLLCHSRHSYVIVRATSALKSHCTFYKKCSQWSNEQQNPYKGDIRWSTKVH